jgi:hypothetical protein
MLAWRGRVTARRAEGERYEHGEALLRSTHPSSTPPLP